MAARTADRCSASKSRTAVAAVHIGRGAWLVLPRLLVVETCCTELHENCVAADMGPQTDGRIGVFSTQSVPFLFRKERLKIKWSQSTCCLSVFCFSAFVSFHQFSRNSV